MPTEIEIRNAIVEVIRIKVPTAKVEARDILDIKSVGWLNILNDASGNVWGWAVSPSGAEPRDPERDPADYNLHFDAWQFYQYRTGEDASNSENQASSEREVVIKAFANIRLLNEPYATTLSWLGPLRFPRRDIGTMRLETHKGQVRLAKGQISCRWDACIPG